MTKYETEKSRVNAWANRRAELIKENNTPPSTKVKPVVTKIPKSAVNQVNLKK